MLHICTSFVAIHRARRGIDWAKAI